MERGNNETQTIRLNEANLGALPTQILRPTYERAALCPGIVHIGLGNFHRAHQAWYLHRLMQTGKAKDWAIVGAGVRSGDAVMREKLMAQDFLTTLIELDPDGGRTAEIIGPMIDFVPVENGNGALVQMMTDPAIRIVSLTVTEGGYYIDPKSGELDIGHADIQHDAAHPNAPRTAFGAMVAALKHRRLAGNGPFTGLSCDNLHNNGSILRQTLVGLASLSDPDLANWIDRSCTFPNSMVDCIVPATGPVELELVNNLGIEDTAPVTHENFRQWVIEDDFCAGRPDWDDVGATYSKNVEGYEAQKIRILNAGHQIVANAAEILGINTIAQAMEHPDIKAMFRKVELEEIAPHVTPVPGFTPEQYVDLVDRRFSNPAIADTARRVAFDGSSRHAGFILPTIRDAFASGASIEGLALVEAAWARMCEGTREDGSKIAPNDPIWEELSVYAARTRIAPGIWLDMRNIYGEIANEPRFVEAFERWLTTIQRYGILQAIHRYLGHP